MMKISEDDFAYTALFAVFDSVDDTALVNEHILKVVAKSICK